MKRDSRTGFFFFPQAECHFNFFGRNKQSLVVSKCIESESVSVQIAVAMSHCQGNVFFLHFSLFRTIRKDDVVI